MEQKNSTNKLLLSLLDSFIEKKEDGILALEAQYGSRKKRVDLLHICNKTHYTHAYEIKSDTDTIIRLNEQLLNYNKNFDYVSILTTEKHIDKIEKAYSKKRKVGLLLYKNENKKIIQLRKPHKNKRLTKKQLARCCTKESLLDIISDLPKNTNLEDVIYEATKKLNIEKLRELAISNFKTRFSKSSKLFIEEANFPVRETDLALLKRQTRLSFVF